MPKNILLIMTDQQRQDSLSCYGCDIINTPNLDSLANQGAKYNNCYVNAPLCTPSRACIMTGKQLAGHNVKKLYDNIGKERLFTKTLQDNGYNTALFGKLHISSRLYECDKRNFEDGFGIYDWCHDPHIHKDSKFNAYAKWIKEKNAEYYKSFMNNETGKNIPKEYHMTHWAAERTIDFIHNAEEPFFAFMSFFDPHNRYDDYPIEYRDRVNIDKIEAPLTRETELPSVFKRLERKNYDEEQITEDKIGYYASIALIDDEVGRVINSLKEKGIYDDTLIIFASDHGDMLMDYNLWTKGAFLNEGDVKVPLIIKSPDIEPNTEVDDLVQLHDIAQTILSFACVNENLTDSMDLIKIANKDIEPRDYAYCLYSNAGIGDGKVYFDPPVVVDMLVHDGYKLNIFYDKLNDIEGELYDLIYDPLEAENLYFNKDYIDVLMKMKDKLLAVKSYNEFVYDEENKDEDLPDK